MPPVVVGVPRATFVEARPEKKRGISPFHLEIKILT
jgi:hypothetical protein